MECLIEVIEAPGFAPDLAGGIGCELRDHDGSNRTPARTESSIVLGGGCCGGTLSSGHDRSLSDFDCEFVSRRAQDRKSTRLNSSHSQISYAVFCLKKKKKKKEHQAHTCLSRRL